LEQIEEEIKVMQQREEDLEYSHWLDLLIKKR
jgi:hypothetical protein